MKKKECGGFRNDRTIKQYRPVPKSIHCDGSYRYNDDFYLSVLTFYYWQVFRGVNVDNALESYYERINGALYPDDSEESYFKQLEDDNKIERLREGADDE